MKKERIICIALAVTAAVLAVFSVLREVRLRRLDARVETVSQELSGERDAAQALRAELQSASQALDDVTGERDALAGELEGVTQERDGLSSALAGMTQERDGLQESLTGAQAELAEANELIEALSSQHAFDPEGPAYQQLYPDFYAPQPIIASEVSQKVMYLTFDDGPSARTDEILATLESENVKATFFIVGSSASSYPGKVKEIFDAGHAVGMHSWSHDYYSIYSSVEAFLDDMYKVFTLIKNETGVAPTYFRFPGGSNNGYAYGIIEEIMAEMLRRGFVPCDWNISSNDAVANTVAVDTIVRNVLKDSSVNRGFVLMHDSYYKTTTAQALPQIIAGLRERGFTFGTLTPEVKPVIFSYATQIRNG